MKFAITGGLLLICALALAEPASAHPVPFSYLDLRLEGNTLDVSLIVHIYDVAHDLGIAPMEKLLEADVVDARGLAIQNLLDRRLELLADGRSLKGEWSQPEIVKDRQSIHFTIHYLLDAMPAVLAIRTNMFPYDPMHQTFINVYENDSLTSQLILDHNHTETDYFAGTRQGVMAVIKKFIPAGIHHILIGPDHLLFLIGLLLLGGSLRQLVLVVTSFTVAHSVTLSLAALNILNPPASIIEPAIALSIVFVGADNLLASGGRDVRPWIALSFGLIHGFGFANVLNEMGLPTQALAWSLFSFNFGVEIGQLMVVIAVATALTAIRSRSEWAGRQLAFAGSIVVIFAGTFWFVQRLFFPGGIS
jgi:hydrogenase/urease accessory protein HupE